MFVVNEPRCEYKAARSYEFRPEQLQLDRNRVTIYDCLDRLPYGVSGFSRPDPFVYGSKSMDYSQFVTKYIDSARRIIVSGRFCNSESKLAEALKNDLATDRLIDLDLRYMNTDMLDDDYPMPSLTRFAFTDNDSHVYNASSFSKLINLSPNLQRLKLDVDIPLTLANNKKLCTIVGRLPLRVLYVRNGNGRLLRCIRAHLIDLQWLGFRHLNVSDIERSVYLPTVESFQIGSMTGEHQPDLPNLKNLFVESTQYDEKVGEFIGQHTNLTHLSLTNIRNMHHADEMMSHLHESTKLSQLSIVAPIKSKGDVQLTKMKCHFFSSRWGDLQMVYDVYQQPAPFQSHCTFDRLDTNRLDDWKDGVVELSEREKELRDVDSSVKKFYV